MLYGEAFRLCSSDIPEVDPSPACMIATGPALAAGLPRVLFVGMAEVEAAMVTATPVDQPLLAKSIPSYHTRQHKAKSRHSRRDLIRGRMKAHRVASRVREKVWSACCCFEITANSFKIVDLRWHSNVTKSQLTVE